MSRCLIQTNRFSKRMRRSLHASPFAAQIIKITKRNKKRRKTP